MAISKIILNGVTQMDLTADTVAANNLISPNTAHDAAGLPVVGTATAGMDIPVFTVTWDSDWEIVQSITCNKTYSECLTISNNNMSALCIETNGNDTDNSMCCCSFYALHTGYLEYVVTASGWESYYDLLYYSNGTITMVNPSAYTRESSDITVSGATVTIPAGEYTIQETKTLASGTEGTPTATKGTVSNHSISVTPSVTNTAGYISGGTHSGTAVTVSASELVSGTYTVDSSGTKDVTNYASASVPAGTAGTPSATKGTVSNHQVSVTPSVTNTTGWITGSTKSGTAVTVTASELASGNKAIVDNGTNIDVVGYSTVSVAVPFSAITVSSSNPTGGNNGDVWIKTS